MKLLKYAPRRPTIHLVRHICERSQHTEERDASQLRFTFIHVWKTKKQRVCIRGGNKVEKPCQDYDCLTLLIATCGRWRDISYIRSQGLNTLFICELQSLSLNFSQLYEVFSYLCSRSLITYFSVSSNYCDAAGNSAELLPYTVPYNTCKCFSFPPSFLSFTGKCLLKNTVISHILNCQIDAQLRE